MTSSEILVVKWLDHAVGWLNPDTGDTETLSDPVSLMFKKLKDRSRKNESKACMDLIESLKGLADQSDIGESAEIHLRCGMVLAELQFFKEALITTHEAVSKYKQGHHHAVALWMEGCIEWALPGKEIDAINSWRESIKSFETLKNVKGLEKQKYEWYEARCTEMKYALHIATEQFGIPPHPPYSDTRTEVKKHILQTLPVIGQIPAGMPSGVMPSNEDYLNINRVSIDNNNFRVVSLLRGEKLVNLPPESCYYVLRVIGNSMNQCTNEPIENGNYVIVRKQEQADPGEIVVAQIIKDQGEGERLATLKRYVVRDGKVLLKPESNDPKFEKPVYTSRIFNKLDNEFQIRGVAIAVLKPDYDSPR